MTLEALLGAALVAPLVHGALLLVALRPVGLRDVVHIACCLVHAGLAIALAQAAARGADVSLTAAQPLPGAEIAFGLEPIGAVFAAVAACVNVLHALYLIGYARTVGAPYAGRVMILSALSIAAIFALSFAADLFTFFVAYQALLLTTFPLLSMAQGEENPTSARLYLATILIAGMALLLPAVVWTSALVGDLSFAQGALLGAALPSGVADVLLALFVFGLAMAGPWPLHAWLIGAGRSPAPIAVFMHSIVSAAGGFALLQVCVRVFGSEGLMKAEIVRPALVGLGAIMLCAGALGALASRDVRDRLSYSTISQSGFALAACLFAGPAGFVAAALHLVAHMVAKAGLFFSMGIVQSATSRTHVPELTGMGRLFPWTIAALCMAGLSLIGAPPFAGAWSKLWAMAAARADGALIVGLAFTIGAVLTFAYIAPLAMRAAFGQTPEKVSIRPDSASLLMLCAALLAGFAGLLLVLIADPIAQLIARAWSLGA